MASIHQSPSTQKNKAIFGKPINFSGITGPLLLLTLVDFIARSAYMTGKTPVLPLFAASLGAG